MTAPAVGSGFGLRTLWPEPGWAHPATRRAATSRWPGSEPGGVHRVAKPALALAALAVAVPTLDSVSD